MAGQGSPYVQRANLVVADLERAFSLYRDVLGFEVEYVIEGDAIEYSREVFGLPAEARLRLCTLNTPDQRRTLALTEVTGIALPPPRSPRSAAVVIRVDDMDAVKAALGALPGVEVMREETLRTQDGRTGREVGIVDADGHLIVLFALPPD